MRVDQQPQFRGSAGTGRAHPSGQPGDGRRRRGHREAHGYPYILRLTIAHKFTGKVALTHDKLFALLGTDAKAKA